MQKDDSIKYKLTQVIDKTNLLSDYIQLNLLAFQYLRNRNYNSAKKSFKECINIAKQLSEFDESKHLESLVNYAISQYFCGKFLDSYSSLERAYQMSSRIISGLVKDKNTLNLHVRILSNICLIALSLNKISDCKNYFYQILDIIEKEKNITNKIFLFKEVIYIFFRIDSLNKFYEENILNNEIFNKNVASKGDHNEINLNNENENQEKLISRRDKESKEVLEEENLKKNISKTLLSLHKFLRENDVDTWIRCLVEESAYFKGIKDVNGYVFTIINQYAADYYKSGMTRDFKNIYQTIINNYGERAKEKNKEKSPEKILFEMKSRIELAVDIYKKLIETENGLFNLFNNNRNLENNINNINIEVIEFKRNNQFDSNEINRIKENNDFPNKNNFKNQTEILQDANNSNKFLIKLFFKHALYKLNKDASISDNNLNKKNIKENNLILENQEGNNPEIRLLNINNSENSSSLNTIKNQIELALKLLGNDEFDVTSINIFNINSEVTKSLKILFENIKMIRNKKELQKALRTWKMKGLGYDKMIDKMKSKYENNKLYFKGFLDQIIKGDEITKIHYTSNGKIVHYYEVDPVGLCLKIYKNQSSKNTNSKSKKINLLEIKEILYGQSSDNLRKRFKNLINKELKEPWLFLCIILNKRSIDLFFENEDKLNRWFYGLKYLIEEKSLPIKIKSTFDFVLTKVKLRIIKELKDYSESSGNNEHKSLLVLTQLREYAQNNHFGFESLSILKVILLYYKVMKIDV